jgi:hypothetical protein
VFEGDVAGLTEFPPLSLKHPRVPRRPQLRQTLEGSDARDPDDVVIEYGVTRRVSGRP